MLKVGTIINEISCLFAIILHKMILKHLETLGYTLSDSDARHYDNELAPTVTPVQLEHRFDVNVCLSGSGFHFYVKADFSEIVR